MKLIGILHVRPNFQKITYNKIARAMKPFFRSTFGFFFHQLYGSIFLHLDATSKHLCNIVLQMVNNILIVKSVRGLHSRFLFFRKIDILKAPDLHLRGRTELL